MSAVDAVRGWWREVNARAPDPVPPASSEARKLDSLPEETAKFLCEIGMAEISAQMNIASALHTRASLLMALDLTIVATLTFLGTQFPRDLWFVPWMPLVVAIGACLLAVRNRSYLIGPDLRVVHRNVLERGRRGNMQMTTRAVLATLEEYVDDNNRTLSAVEFHLGVASKATIVAIALVVVIWSR
jgi:hypothetical protein